MSKASQARYVCDTPRALTVSSPATTSTRTSTSCAWGCVTLFGVPVAVSIRYPALFALASNAALSMLESSLVPAMLFPRPGIRQPEGEQAQDDGLRGPTVTSGSTAGRQERAQALLHLRRHLDVRRAAGDADRGPQGP